MGAFLLRMLIVSVTAAFLLGLIKHGQRLWTYIIFLETVGAALGLMFFSAIGGFLIFYIFVYWKYKAFDQIAYNKISWGIWVIMFIPNLLLLFLGK